MPRPPLTHESSEWYKSNECCRLLLPSDRSLNQRSHRSKMATESTEGSTATLARLLSNGLGARGDQDRDPLEYPHRTLHVLLALSGSVASIKAPLIVRELLTVRLQCCCSSFSLFAEALPFCLAPKSCSPSPLPRWLQYANVDVQVVASKSSTHFFSAEQIERESTGRVRVWTDADEWAVSSRVVDACSNSRADPCSTRLCSRGKRSVTRFCTSR